jgi:hypothetical protein
MSDKYRTLRVLLTDDLSAEQAAAVEAAVGMVKGVESVERGPPVGGEDLFARRAALGEHARLLGLLNHAAMFDARRYAEVRALLERDA